MDIYDKSLETLKQIIDAQKEHNFMFVLIGGWAIWAYNPYMKSRDIDLVISKEDFWKLKNFLISLGFSETYGGHLGKKGFAMLYDRDKIEIDVYDETVAGFDAKRVINSAVQKAINAHLVGVASITNLVTMKLKSAIDRTGSAKGEKDLSDLLAILDKYFKNIEWSVVIETVGKKEIAGVMMILFSDIRQSQKFYRMDFGKFMEMKKYFKKFKFI